MDNVGRSPLATAALVVSIAGPVLSLVPCCCMTFWLGFPLNVAALILWYVESKNIERGESGPENVPTIRMAKTLGIVGLCINAVYVLLVVLYFAGIISLGLFSSTLPR